jgi:group I intron endonuclease
MIGIYGLQNKSHPERWNIGQSRDIHARWYTAYELGHCKSQPKIYNALKKYGYDGFEKRVIELCDEGVPQDVLDIKEQSWIQHFDSVNRGYNCTLGGQGRLGKPHSEETKRKLRQMFLGRTVSAETRAKQSKARRGIRFTEQHKKNLSTSLMGKSKSPYKRRHKRIMSDEVKRQISIALKGRPMSEEQKLLLSQLAKERWKKRREQCSTPTL